MSSLYGPIRYSEQELRKNIQFMDSSGYHQQQHYHQLNSGLVRYRSAPSSLLSALVDGNNGGSDEYHPYSQASSSAKETMMAKFMPSSNEWRISDAFHESEDMSVKQEVGESVPQRPHQSNSYAYEAQMTFEAQATTFANGNLNGGNDFDGSYRVLNSSVPDNSIQPEVVARNYSNLGRQNSSPAGFFNKSTAENGLAALRQVGCSRVSDNTNGESIASASRMNGQISFSYRPSSYSNHLPHIAEIENENMDATFHENVIPGNCNGSRNPNKTTGFTRNSWDISSSSGLKQATGKNGKMLSVSSSMEIQTAEFENHSHGLSHQFSWPSSYTKMASIDKLMQVQGSVQCKVRAKRGFATHPRSIAERVRRTRITERIKTLEGLFPEIDKQTNTADKLELAVGYIKELQSKLEMLTAARSKCTCSSAETKD